MKIFKPIKIGLLLSIGVLSIMSSQAAFAVGDTVITNTVNVTYSTGAATGLTGDATVSFIEDRLVNFTVSAPGAYTEVDAGTTVAVGVAPIAGPANGPAVMAFTVQNTGNSIHDFRVSAIDTSSPTGFGTDADNFNQAVSVFVDGNNDGIYQSATDTATFIDNLCPSGTTEAGTLVTANVAYDCDSGDVARDSTITVFIVPSANFASSGLGGSDGDVSALGLVVTAAEIDNSAVLTDDGGTADNSGTAVTSATSTLINGTETNGSTLQTVLNDSDSNSGTDAENISAAATLDVAQNGIVVDTGAYRINAATLVITKSVDVLFDPVNCTAALAVPTVAEINTCIADATANPKAIPGAILEYTILIDNDGTSSADDLSVTDAIDASMLFYPDTYAVGTGIQIVTGGTTTDLTNAADADIGSFAGTTVTVGGATLDLAAENGTDPGDGSETDEAVITFRVQLQ